MIGCFIVAGVAVLILRELKRLSALRDELEIAEERWLRMTRRNLESYVDLIIAEELGRLYDAGEFCEQIEAIAKEMVDNG